MRRSRNGLGPPTSGGHSRWASIATSSVSFRWAAVVAFLPLVVAFAPYLRRDRGVVDPTAQAAAEAVPWRPLLLIGAALVLFYMVDTAAFTWGPTYLDHAVDAPTDLVALATFPYLLASGFVRLSGDGLVRRHGAVSPGAPRPACRRSGSPLGRSRYRRTARSLRRD